MSAGEVLLYSLLINALQGYIIYSLLQHKGDLESRLKDIHKLSAPPKKKEPPPKPPEKADFWKLNRRG